MKRMMQSLLVIWALYLTSYGYSTENPSTNNCNYDATPTELTGFTYVYGSGPSTVQSFTVEDPTELTYTLTAPTGFEVSWSSSTGFSNSISGDFIAPTIYVRMTSGLTIGTYSGALTLTTSLPSFSFAGPSPSAAETITLSGEVTRRTCTWNGTIWDTGDPDAESAAIINADYNTAFDGSLEVWSLQVNSPYKLTIGDNTYCSVYGDVTVSGDLWVENHGALVQIDNSATFTLNSGGSSRVNKFTSQLNHWYDYTYWSTPVSGAITSSAFAFSNTNMRFKYDASNFLDVLAEVGNTNTYVAGHDDIDDNGDDWVLLSGSEPLIPGVGYAATHSSTGFVAGNSYQYNFVGPFNTGTITTPIYYNGDNGDKDWNLIGNPYPCAISADVFFAENSGVVAGSVYLWSHGTPPSNTSGGNQVYNFSADDYAIINAGSGEIAGGSGVIPNRYIPSGQSFFVQGLTNGSATFTNAMRVGDNTSNSQFFRDTTQDAPNKLWLNLTTESGVFNQILVAYVVGATNANDGEHYDTPRVLSSESAATIYSLIPGENTSFAIQGKAINTLGVTEVIPVGFQTNIPDVSVVYTFSIPKKEGDFLNSNPIYLKDNLLSTLTDLTQTDYSFTSAQGNFGNRFEIVFENETLSIPSLETGNASLQLYELNANHTKISVANDLEMTSVALYDLMGRRVLQQELNGFEDVIITPALSKGTYIAKVELNDGTVLSKKLLKRL